MKPEQFAKRVREHVRNKYDCVIAITSIWEGDGKSTLAKILDDLIDDNFDLEKNVLYNPTAEGIKKLVMTLPPFSVIDADEAIKAFYKLKWADRLSIFLNQLYALARKRKLITILCMPRYRDFTEFFRNHKIKYWIHIVDRGIAIVHEKTWNPYSKDPWYLDENDKIIEKAINRKGSVSNFTNEEKIKIFKRCKNVFAIIEFDELDSETEKRYEDLAAKYAFDDITIENQSDKRFKQDAIVSEIMSKLDDYLTPFSKQKNKVVVDESLIAIDYDLGKSKALEIKRLVERELARKKKQEGFSPSSNSDIIINKAEIEKSLKKMPV